jgi:hypothetical protein
MLVLLVEANLTEGTGGDAPRTGKGFREIQREVATGSGRPTRMAVTATREPTFVTDPRRGS